MRHLQDRVVIVTGAGRGLGRAHSLYMARLGASIVVNDLGVTVDGETEGYTPAETVAAEVAEAGGRAIASHHDVADWGDAGELIDVTIDAFGHLDVLVNNAGILRDRTLAKMSPEEWDSVIHVHLRGHAAPTAHAMAYWRSRSKAGHQVRASVIHTTSIAAITGSFGQANYTAAKSGIIGLSKVVALEGQKYGVRSNAISPTARTRIGLQTPGVEDVFMKPEAPDAFDRFDPENVSPLVAWLARADCPANSQLFHIDSNRVLIFNLPSPAYELSADGRWTIESLSRELDGKLIEPASASEFLSFTETDVNNG